MDVSDASGSMFIKWSPRLSVNSPTLDMHHQILIGCLNRLHLMQDKWMECLPAVGKELWTLINYCRIHFFVEEKAMDLCGVSAATMESHKKIHRSIVKKMGELWEKFETRPVQFPFDETLKFLQVWLVKHVQEEDRSTYGEHMAGNRNVEQQIRYIRYADVAKKLELKQRKTKGLTLDGAQVMVVEANLDRRNHLARPLQERGAHILQANNPQEARTLLETNYPNLALVHWNGDEARELVNDIYTTRDLPVVISYFGDMEDILDEAETVGASNIVIQPASAQDIQDVANTTLSAIIPLRALVAQRLEEKGEV